VLGGSSNAATFRSDLLGDDTVVEAEREGLIAGPGPTAYSLFADLLDALGAEPLAGA
jgi:homoserine dehydrogenase